MSAMFELILNQYLLKALFALLLSLVLTFLAVKVFPKWGLMDRPQKYNLGRAPIPYYGGIAIFLAFLISVLIFVPMSRELIGLLIGGAVIVIVGFFDDMFDLSPWLRLFCQFVAATVLVAAGIYIFSMKLPFFGTLDFTVFKIGTFPVLAGLFAVLWVMSILNTMNFLDGVSGLNSGITFVAALALFGLSIHPGIHENPVAQQNVATLALILSMVALGFLVFDFPKPKILMGDSGSTFLGFTLATLAIFSGGKVATAFLVLGVPILDMVWVVGRRLYEGKKFWQGDLKHMHHRLLALGMTERTVLIFYYSLTAIFGLTAVVFVNTQQKFFILISLVVLMLALAGVIVFLPRRNSLDK